MHRKMEDQSSGEGNLKASTRDCPSDENATGRLINEVNKGLAVLTLRLNLNAELVEICHSDRESGDLIINYMAKDGVLHRKEIPACESGVFAAALRFGHVIKVTDAGTDQRYDRTQDQHTDVEIKNLILCPLLDSKNLVWGVAAVANLSQSGLNTPTESEIDQTNGLDVNQRALLEASNENTMTFLLQMCEIGGQCISNAIVWRELDATREKADGLLNLMHSLFSDRLGIQSNGLLGECVEQGKVIVIENAYEDERFDPKLNFRFGVEI
ncbi:GAF-like domain superfamily, partial [Babesia duncani]